MRKRLTYLLLAVVAGGAVLGLPRLSDAELADTPDPATIPVPAFDDSAIDPAKSVVVRMDFQSRTAATVRSAVVSPERAHGRPGDPPILRLSLADPDGHVIDRMNAWSPLWVFTHDDRERLEITSSGSGSFVVPFSPTLASMTVHDIALARDVATVDLTTPIKEFCVSRPSDPDCREADLAVDSVMPTAPLFAVLGQPVTVTVVSTVSNAGPDGPADARMTRSVAAGAGLSVTPAEPETVEVTALGAGESRSLTTTYSVTCTEPGVRTIDFTTAIGAKFAAWTDPNAANDSRSAQLPVDCAVPVTINVMPGSTLNPVNLNGSVLPVAVLTTAAGEYGHPLPFNATTIEASSLRFASRSVLLAGGGVTEVHSATHPEDSLELDEATRDGDLDAVLHFRPRSDAFAPTDTEGCAFGRATGPAGPVSFFGCDYVDIL